MKTTEEKYQAKFNTLAEAKAEAQLQSQLNKDVDYSIIESLAEGMKGQTKVFYVENEAAFIRAWETGHGYYLNGKYNKS